VIRFQAALKDFSLPQSVWISSMAQPASY